MPGGSLHRNRCLDFDFGLSVLHSNTKYRYQYCIVLVRHQVMRLTIMLREVHGTNPIVQHCYLHVYISRSSCGKARWTAVIIELRFLVTRENLGQWERAVKAIWNVNGGYLNSQRERRKKKTRPGFHCFWNAKHCLNNGQIFLKYVQFTWWQITPRIKRKV